MCNYKESTLFEVANQDISSIASCDNSSIKLYNDDCMNVLKQMQDSSVDLIIADPPYQMKNNERTDLDSRYGFDILYTQLNSLQIAGGYDIELFGEQFIRVLKSINIYVWCNKFQIYDYLNFYVNKHQCSFDILCWHKSNALPTYSNKYLTDTEYLLFFRKGKGKCFPKCYNDAKTYYIAPINQRDKKLYEHPTIKPLDIIERIIRNSSKENDVVLDPFMGSGTTGVACKYLGRNFIGVELNNKYFDIAKNRIDSCYSYKERHL